MGEREDTGSERVKDSQVDSEVVTHLVCISLKFKRPGSHCFTHLKCVDVLLFL